MPKPLESKLKVKRFKSLILIAFRDIARFFNRQLLELARDSRRKTNEFDSGFLYRYGVEIFGSFFLLVVFVVSFGPSLVNQISLTRDAQPELRIGSDRWRLLFDTSGACELHLRSDCTGSPENSNLWSSNKTINDLSRFETLQNLENRKFWAGIYLSSAEVALAEASGASMVELGLMNAAYRIFLNGDFIDSGNGSDFYPATIQLPDSLLKAKAPIFISVELHHNLGSRLPIWHPAEFGGLYTPEKVRLHRNKWLFLGTYRYLIVTTWASLSGLIFLLLWCRVPKKVEYLFYALFLFNYSLLRFSEIGPITFGTNRNSLYVGTYWLIAAEGTLGCLLGAVYARVSRIYLLWVIGTGTLIAVAGFYSANNQVEVYWWKDALMKYSTPTFLVIGSVFCVAQSNLLRRERPLMMHAQSLRLRVNRLRLFSFLLILLALVFYSESIELLSTVPQFLNRSIQMVLVAAIGIILLNEFQARERQFEIVQRSPFHEPFGGQSGEVFGFVVSFDLMNSSALSNFAASQKNKERPTTVWNNLIGGLLIKRLGFKVADEGDGFKVFFESNNTSDDLSRIIDAISEASVATEALQHDLRSKGVIPINGMLQFRAGLLWGGLHPVWKEFFGVKTAEWEDAQGTTTFKDVTRIMDSEKKLRNRAPDGSVLVIASEHVSILSKFLKIEVVRSEVRDVGEMTLGFVLMKEFVAASLQQVSNKHSA